jgi:hypothetical protein
MQIGSRLELFIDHYLIDRLDGLRLKMHPPRQVPLSPSPVRGYYMTVLRDGDIYRAYYRDHACASGGLGDDGSPGEITCYAESQDGHIWQHPQLGIHEVESPDGKNVILDAAPFSHNFSPFLDTRPGVPPSERFKALAGTQDGNGGGLFAFVSDDGIQWRRRGNKAVITSKERAFDSQNVAFWSQAENCYVCYYRTWHTPHGELRTISRTTSQDFLQWSAPVAMNPNVAGEHLYTNNTHPYFRAPHIYVVLPTRFLPERGNSTDVMLMTSRCGSRFERPFMEAFMRPGLEPDRWGNRANYVALNVVPTGPAEMSVYHAPSGCRYVLRIDGFTSLHADYAGGEMISRVFTFSGRELSINYSTSAAGMMCVEIQSPEGQALPNYRLADCMPLVGDEIESVVRWRHGTDVSHLSGKPVRLRYVLQDADLFSMRFCH